MDYFPDEVGMLLAAAMIRRRIRSPDKTPDDMPVDGNAPTSNTISGKDAAEMKAAPRAYRRRMMKKLRKEQPHACP